MKNISSIQTPHKYSMVSTHDMVNGLHDWKNISPIVRNTFAHLIELMNDQAHVIKKQSEKIRQLEERDRELENYANEKATRSEVALEMNKALSKIEQTIEGKCSTVDVMGMLNSKIDRDEMQRAMENKVDRGEFAEEMQKKSSQNDLNEFVDMQNREFVSLKSTVAQKANTVDVFNELKKKAYIEEVKDALSTKANVSDIRSALYLKADSAHLEAALQKVATKEELAQKVNTTDVKEALQTKVDIDSMKSIREQLQDDIAHIKQSMQERITHVKLSSTLASFATQDDLSAARTAMRREQEQHAAKAAETSSNTTQKIMQQLERDLRDKASTDDVLKVTRIIKELRDSVEERPTISDVKEALSAKVSLTDLTQDIARINQTLEEKANKESVIQAFKKKVSHKDIKTLIENYAKVDEIYKQLLLKASKKDVLSLLENKSNAADLENTMDTLQKSIRKRVTIDQYSQSLRDQSMINEALLSQNSLGRWVWKSGKLKSGHGVPWNVQIINTNPENFVWEVDRVNILVVQPGLYEVQFGFYGKKLPVVELHINGQSVLAAGVNKSSNVIYTRNSKTSSRSPSTHMVTGLSHTDFIAIPAKARVAISYNGGFSDKGEGFIGL
eukprot:CAMPEP_0117418398 /NCGR_PEP_ID=MMETSP0758-20121206/191_1 /TAXON_ID=63605 /ORGANISM="Percolomonas cosmopolitus, Strain AE-1 (ATCC 50343)" /LENGTH=615 /DNA_ID=CAMNT_0005198885 /DNA_START=23 /DNA_END=1866 /DNA_ORIENTATION=+